MAHPGNFSLPGPSAKARSDHGLACGCSEPSNSIIGAFFIIPSDDDNICEAETLAISESLHVISGGSQVILCSPHPGGRGQDGNQRPATVWQDEGKLEAWMSSNFILRDCRRRQGPSFWKLVERYNKTTDLTHSLPGLLHSPYRTISGSRFLVLLMPRWRFRRFAPGTYTARDPAFGRPGNHCRYVGSVPAAWKGMYQGDPLR